GGARADLPREPACLRRARRRLHLDRSADALGAVAPRLPGGRMTVAAVETATLQEEIRELARARDAVILAHNYQVPSVQDVADYVGDSLGLSRQAAATDADAIVLRG